MAKDRASSVFTLSTELADGDVRLSISVRASGANAAVNQEAVNTIKVIVQEKLLEMGNVAGQ